MSVISIQVSLLNYFSLKCIHMAPKYFFSNKPLRAKELTNMAGHVMHTYFHHRFHWVWKAFLEYSSLSHAGANLGPPLHLFLLYMKTTE